MARIRAVDGAAPRTIDEGWRLAVTPSGACAGPGDLDGLDWIAARVPGTAAAALRDAGRWSEARPTPLHHHDIWYRTELTAPGWSRLGFEGLATLAEVWLDDELVLRSRSMFVAHAVEAELVGRNRLAICFRSLRAELDRPHARGRWRPRLATPGSLRHVRTSLLGFMPGWCPPVDIAGPYRPVTLTPLPAERPSVTSADVRTALDGRTGRLTARLRVEGPAMPATLRCDGREAAFRETAPGLIEAELALPGIALWWPHTHGEPRLHAVEARIGGAAHDLGRVGFRTLALTRPFEEGFGLAVNGVPVFCRGANWMPPDLVGLDPGPEGCRHLLALAREAGMNMLRVPGTTLYESDAFHDLCDELGILVWQDLMLANFDYPHDDPTFADILAREVGTLLGRTQTSPSLCVLCGGSEVRQQAAMMGFSREIWDDAFSAHTLPALAARLRPDLLVVPNSPSGGDLPFSTSAGTAHYYGVGAYRRPLEDARRAEVGFATECLAFAGVPETATLAEAGLLDPSGALWAAGIPRDRGADWDFEDVRDHYVGLLFGVDPARLRREDPARYLELGRAAVAEVIEATFAEWRRARSPNAGGLVWVLRDLAAGAGWGVVDAAGRPKSAWYAMKRAFRTVQVTLSDEGLNGIDVHVHNETAGALALGLHLAFTDAAGRTVAKADLDVEMDARSSRVWSSAALLGRFFDATDSYRFGPPAHTLSHAWLTDREGGAIAESFHFPQGRQVEPMVIGLRVEPVAGSPGPALLVSTERHALCVHVDTACDARPSDNWFHLAPGSRRLIVFPGAGRPPRGTVRAVNGREIVEFGQDDG